MNNAQLNYKVFFSSVQKASSYSQFLRKYKVS